jgi:hypothetical protein
MWDHNCGPDPDCCIRHGLAAAYPLLADRLAKALQVCEHTVHRVDPTEAELHAAQQASGAYATDWRPEYVHDDLPDFEYREVTP